MIRYPDSPHWIISLLYLMFSVFFIIQAYSMRELLNYRHIKANSNFGIVAFFSTTPLLFTTYFRPIAKPIFLIIAMLMNDHHPAVSRLNYVLAVQQLHLTNECRFN